MKVAFCYDGPLKKDSSNFYGISINNEVLQRYYTIGEEVKVLIRTKNLERNENTKKLSQINKEFDVIEIDNISSLKGQLTKKKYVTQKINEEIGSSDYVVARLPSFIGSIAVDQAKKLNKPYLIEVVGHAWDGYWNHSLKGKVVAPVMYNRIKRLVYSAPFVVYVTNEFLQNKYPTKGESSNISNVILNEINDQDLFSRIEKIKNKDLSKKIIIGTTAAVNVKFKGQQHIIKTLKYLKEQGYNNFEYQLVGAGDQTFLKDIAKKYGVEDKVVFLGPMKHEEVFKWLENIDIYAQPSKQEGLPRSMIEAMSKALPAIGAKTAGIPELISSEYVFDNKMKIEEIGNILIRFDKQTMINQAKVNFNESKKYKREIIENRRKQFFKKFKNESYYRI